MYRRVGGGGLLSSATSEQGFSIQNYGTYYSVSRWDTKADPITAVIVEKTDAKDERDVRVNHIVSGGWVFSAGGATWAENTGKFSATVVQVKP